MRALEVSSTGTLRSTNVDFRNQAATSPSAAISLRADSSSFSKATSSTHPRAMNIFLSKPSAGSLRKLPYTSFAFESFRFEKTSICVFS